ncbi:hypothetical protein [Natrialba taiwanensis]|uniref:RelE toxin-related domain-containing protein n=1 Tax=Natrialba taiwanensis DSM 12281 TaxID=1230458 RepID=M0AGW9_9EURY|nr:hypothetical protein [Natrialba taiwanensis]ELY96618.1 hypothetical protein C484_00750 [Natrialba taiwanensis DSM 12281]
MSAKSSGECDTVPVVWTQHGREQWHNERRNAAADRSTERAWRESVEVDYPSARDGARGRYHPDGDCVLIVKRDAGGADVVVTVINLNDRGVREQAYVRYQAAYGWSQ